MGLCVEEKVSKDKENKDLHTSLSSAILSQTSPVRRLIDYGRLDMDIRLLRRLIDCGRLDMDIPLRDVPPRWNQKSPDTLCTAAGVCCGVTLARACRTSQVPSWVSRGSMAASGRAREVEISSFHR